MNSCQDTKKPHLVSSFKFLPYKTLTKNFLIFKEMVFKTFASERYDQLRELVLVAAMRQIKMNPSGMLENEESCPFNAKGKAIAVTGIMLKLRKEINNYFVNLPVSNSSFLQVATNKVLHLTGHSERMRLLLNDKINQAIGIQESNQFDEEALYKVNCVLKQLKQLEEFPESFRAPMSESATPSQQPPQESQNSYRF